MNTDQLLYRDATEFSLLPHWAKFFLALGKQLGTHDSTTRYLRVGISVPTRLMNSVLIGTGLIIERASVPATLDAAAYFDFLCQLPMGTLLSFTSPSGGREFTGSLCGIKNDEQYKIGICVQKGSHGANTHWFGIDHAPRIRLAASGIRPTTRAAGSRTGYRSSFVGPLLVHSDPNMFALESRLDCLMVGCLASLTSEATNYLFSSTSHSIRSRQRIQDASLCEGTLQDILRARSLLHDGQAYRSDMFSTRSSKNLPSNERPHTVVFDGAPGYLRHRERWLTSHQVVVLDRTERLFQDAASQCNQEYLTRLQDVTASFPLPPNGIEITAFEVLI